MKNKLKHFRTLALCAMTTFLFAVNLAHAEVCFPEGCYTDNINHASTYAERYNQFIDEATKYLGDTSNLTGDFTFFYSNSAGHNGNVTDTFLNGVLIKRTCFNGEITSFTPSTCPNGAINKPECSICPAGSNMVNNKCVCANGATGAQCNICPAGQVMQNNLCVCANGATNPTACSICPAGSNMLNGTCTCGNSADVFAQCNSCKSGQVFNNNGQCVDGCSTTNVCGQTIQGFMNNGTCELATGPGVNPNNSCIIDFNVTTNTVNPNGSVEFSWSLANLPKGVSSKCGFVDLTTPTPRPIPGLQNLDPNIDRIRINNVQSTTRFCLVCQYFNLLQNNTLLGEAVKHQWVRVIKVNEN